MHLKSSRGEAKVRTGLGKTDRPGSKRGLAETWVMGVRLRPTGKPGG